MNEGATYRPAGTLRVSTALEPYGGTWDERTAAHLLRRAGFGGSATEVARAAQGSMNHAVDALVRFPSTSSLPDAPAGLPDPSEIFAALRALALDRSGRSEEALKEQRKQLARLFRQGYVALGSWWLERMVATPAPLQEKMTLLWHGHFASATGQKGITPQEGMAQNQLFRRYALGNVRELTLEVSKDPAMLKYLDNARSVKEHPNENYARELMELFTLGIGNYTEEDVREGARAFTGWSVRRPLAGGGFVYDAGRHDGGPKRFLGMTGTFDGTDIVNIIFEQPAAARWFARKLLVNFVYSDPEPELVGALAASIVSNGYDLQPVLSMLLRSNVFYSERSYRALVKSPAEFAVGTYKLLEIKEPDAGALAAMARMGQVLFRPPSVKGWDGGAAWLNSATMLTRANFVGSVMNAVPGGGPGWMMQSALNASAVAERYASTVLQGDASPAAIAQVEAYLDGSGTSALGALSGENVDERLRGAVYLTMAMPAYQLN